MIYIVFWMILQIVYNRSLWQKEPASFMCIQSLHNWSTCFFLLVIIN